MKFNKQIVSLLISVRFYMPNPKGTLMFPVEYCVVDRSDVNKIIESALQRRCEKLQYMIRKIYTTVEGTITENYSWNGKLVSICKPTIELANQTVEEYKTLFYSSIYPLDEGLFNLREEVENLLKQNIMHDVVTGG